MAVTTAADASINGAWQNMDVAAVDGVFQQAASALVPTSYSNGSVITNGIANIIFDIATNGTAAVETQEINFGSGGIGSGGTGTFLNPIVAGDSILAVFISSGEDNPGAITYTDTSGNTYIHASAAASGGYAQADVFLSIGVAPTASLSMTWASSGGIGDGYGVAWVVKNLSGVPPAPPSVFIQAVPSTITLGQSSTLNWVATNSTSQSINEGIGGVAATGSLVVTPDASTYYWITAVNGIGSATAVAYVEVLGANSYFSLQKIVLELKTDKIPKRGRA